MSSPISPSSPSSSSPLQEPTDPAPSSPLLNLFKSTLSQNHLSMDTLAEELTSLITTHAPEVREKVNQFACEHQTFITALKHRSWNDHKASLGTRMTQPHEGASLSLEQFRKVANQALADACSSMGEKMGLPKVQWTACGTEGFQSDVDIVVQGQNLSTVDAIFYKTLRDALHTSIFGGLSGVQLDTEVYIPHPAELELNKKMVSKEAQQAFAVGEKANVILQRYVSLSQHPHLYKESKKKDLQSIAQTEERRAMSTLYRKVEVMMKKLDQTVYRKMMEQQGMTLEQLSSLPLKEIKQQAKEILRHTPQAFKQAREVVIIPMRLQIGEQIAALQEKLSRSSLLSEEELTHHYTELQKLTSIACYLQDEGTHTSAEGEVTLFKKSGQIHMGKKKRARNQLHQKEKEAQGLFKHLLKSGKREVLELHTLSAARNQLNPDTGFAAPSWASLLTASYEEACQFEHVIQESLLSGLTPTHAAIQSGKYCQRTCRNQLRALLQIKERLKEQKMPFPKELISLTARARSLERKATALEKNKRKFHLSAEVTTHLLTQALSGDATRNKAQISSVLSPYRFGGEQFSSLLTPEELLSKVSLELSKRALLKVEEDSQGFFSPTHPEIRHILQAYAGWDRTHSDHAHLNSLHLKAESLTGELLGLQSEEEVEEWAQTVLTLGAAIRNFARDQGYWITSIPSQAEGFDLSQLLFPPLTPPRDKVD